MLEASLSEFKAKFTNSGTKLLLARLRGGGGLGSGPLDFFFFFNLVYIYIILFLVICFNKIALFPLNNIIDIFKSYKKILAQ